IFKAIDSSSSQVRHAAADCFAEALVQGFSDSPAAADALALKSKKSKAKPSKRPTAGFDEDEIGVAGSRPQSPAPSKKSQVLAMSFAEIVKTLSNQYVRSSTSNRARAGIAVCYGKLLKRLGEKTVESNYVALVENL